MSRRNSVSHGHLGGHVLGTRTIQRLDHIDHPRPADWDEPSQPVARHVPPHVIARRRAARQARRRTRQAARRG